MALPPIPVAPGTRARLVVSRPLYLNRFVGHASQHQDVRQALGEDVEVTLRRSDRTGSATTGTLDHDGHVGVATGIDVTLLGATWTIEDDPLAAAHSPAGVAQRLLRLGYLPQAYRPSDVPVSTASGMAAGDPALAHMIYDFQADHGIIATGHLDEATQARILEVFGG